MDKKISVLALLGKSGVGKDTLAKGICAAIPEVTHQVMCSTTRPPRQGEENGKDYYFLTTEDFARYVLNGDMVEATCFRDWFYGTSIEAFNKEKVNVVVCNPEGFIAMKQDSRLNVYGVLIESSAKERLMRQLAREASPDVNEIIRRYKADEEDFDEAELFISQRIENRDGYAGAESAIEQLCNLIKGAYIFNESI